VTAHDGFTLHDLVSYNDKHNEANGEDNADGESHNRSWNHGVEGPTDDVEVHALRERQKRNFVATLLLSQGVPMISHGDELGRTQGGNNNVYAQDNEISWVDWDEARNNELLTEFTARLAALRGAHPVFRRQRFFQGRPIRGSSVDDIAWLRRDGQQMSEGDWNGGHAQSLAIFLNGRGIPDRDEVGERAVDDSFLLLINAHHQKVTFALPDAAYGAAWQVVVDTADPLLAHTRRRPSGPGDRQRLLDRSMRVLRRTH
jgi:isoamylase